MLEVLISGKVSAAQCQIRKLKFRERPIIMQTAYARARELSEFMARAAAAMQLVRGRVLL